MAGRKPRGVVFILLQGVLAMLLVPVVTCFVLLYKDSTTLESVLASCASKQAADTGLVWLMLTSDYGCAISQAWQARQYDALVPIITMLLGVITGTFSCIHTLNEDGWLPLSAGMRRFASRVTLMALLLAFAGIMVSSMLVFR